ncbi:MAG: phosphoribosylanthranilate isomerase [Anaerolineae bacterium]
MVKCKICGLTNYADARWAADCGADLLGFIFVPASPRCIEPGQAAEIITRLRAEGCPARMVGVFANQELAWVQNVSVQCGLDYIQLHGGESAAFAAALGMPVIIARRIAQSIPWEDLAAYQAEAYLLDTYREGALGGTGAAWDLAALAEAPDGVRLILAGGLHPGNVAEAVNRADGLGVSPWAVDTASGVESRPGIKDKIKEQAFIRAAHGEQ